MLRGFGNEEIENSNFEQSIQELKELAKIW